MRLSENNYFFSNRGIRKKLPQAYGWYPEDNFLSMTKSWGTRAFSDSLLVIVSALGNRSTSESLRKVYKLTTCAPGKAGCFLPGESPCRVRNSQPPVPSVAWLGRIDTVKAHYFRIHPLRNSGASVMDNNHVPIGSIQKILGHENRKTMEIYLHSIGDSERKAMQVYRRFSKDSHTKKNKGVRPILYISLTPLYYWHCWCAQQDSNLRPTDS